MAINIENEPYVTLIPEVRSGYGDLITSDLTIDDLQFTDENIGSEINRSFNLMILRDTDTELRVDNTSNLDPAILLDDNLSIRILLIKAAILGMINQIYQQSTRENITIRRTGSAISLDSLVQGLQRALNSARNNYNHTLVSISDGDLLIP